MNYSYDLALLLLYHPDGQKLSIQKIIELFEEANEIIQTNI